MTTRIGLFTHAKKQKQGSRTTSNIYVDIDSLGTLSSKLNELGARQVGLMCRDRTGTTRLEGQMFPVADLKETHLTWLSEKPEQFATRALFFE